MGVGDSVVQYQLSEIMARMAAMESKMMQLYDDRVALLRERDARGKDAATAHESMRAAAQEEVDDERRKNNEKIQEVARQPERRVEKERIQSARRVEEERAQASRGRAHPTRQTSASKAREHETSCAAVTSPHGGVAAGGFKPKDMKFDIRKFDGKEIYPLLGFDFERWRNKFL